MIERVSALCFLLLGQSDLVDAALVDVRKLAPEQQVLVRYLVAGPHAKEDDPKVLSGHVTGLSKETDITLPARVAPGLFRVNLDDYGWDREVYERLANADPWYHVRVELQLRGKKFKRTAQAPWMGKGIYELVYLTQSQAPILRMDWFFNQTTAGEGRDPNYYDFLGIKDEKTFHALVGYDSKRKRRKVELREAVAESGVSPGRARGIVRETAEDGALWLTYDFRKAVDKLNPLRVLGRDLDREFRKADVNDVATEQFGHLPNGMWAWYLGNNKGERQVTAPDFAASDNRSKSNDHRVHINVSCIRCHADAGIQPIDGWIRNLISPPLALQSPDYKVLRELRQQYLRKLEPFIEKDKLGHAVAVLEATGWKAEVYATKYAEYWERYEDARVDAEYAALDLGIDVKVFQRKLGTYLQATNQLDSVLSAFLLEGRRARTIGIRQWEEAHVLAREIVK